MTTRAGVIGMPIRHSLSPAIFTAAFVATGLDWSYEAFEVPEGEGEAFARRVRSDLEGLSVTMPHKASVIPALDDLSDIARDLGAVNCIVRRGGSLVGHNTDGPGFVDSLVIDEGISISGMRCALLGAGEPAGPSPADSAKRASRWSSSTAQSIGPPKRLAWPDPRGARAPRNPWSRPTSW